MVRRHDGNTARTGLCAGGFYIADKRAQSSRIEFPGALRRLTWDPGLTNSAAISADGKLVAYASDRANQGNLDIYVQQVEGGGAVRLTTGPADHDEPTLTPDGARVAFETYGEEAGIYEMPSLGGTPRLLVRHGRRPRFSPDGRFLLYAVGLLSTFRAEKYDNLNDGWRVYVQALAGGDPMLLSKGCTVNALTSCWSPDGEQVMFNGICGGARNGWLARRDGAGSLRPVAREYRNSWTSWVCGIRGPVGHEAGIDREYLGLDPTLGADVERLGPHRSTALHDIGP